MIVAFVGPMGSGKTSAMVSIGISLVQMVPGIRLGSRGELKVENYERILTWEQLKAFRSGVLLLDEFWLDLDSRNSKENAQFTRWVNQSRKKDLICLYTTQSIGQVDKRVRAATDLVIFCDYRKNVDKLICTFVDYNYGIVFKKLAIDRISEFQKLFDTYEVIEPLY